MAESKRAVMAGRCTVSAARHAAHLDRSDVVADSDKADVKPVRPDALASDAM